MNAESRRRLVALLAQVKTVSSEGLESDTIEFKWYANENALQNASGLTDEITAFANSLGGEIVVGVLDDSDVPPGEWESQLHGIPSVDTILTRERILGRIVPAIPIEVENLDFEGKNYVVISVPRIRHSLVGSRSGRFCLREGRSSRPMTPDEVRSKVQDLQTYDWSAQDIDASTADLDPEVTEDARLRYATRRQMAEQPSREAFLEAVGITRNGLVTKGGLLFLGLADKIRDCLGTFEYRFTWRRANGDLELNEVWRGSLWGAIAKALDLFDRCNSTLAFRFNDVGYEAPLLDKEAFHEAFLNALVHRDYGIDGMVSVDFLGDEITIVSPGGFYGGVTAENIARHEPRHRNGALAQTLMNYGFVDRAGVGVQRMGVSSLMYGRRFPRFREVENTVKVVMQATYYRAGVFVIASENNGGYGVPELLLLNTLYGAGAIPVREAEALISPAIRTIDSSWTVLKRAVENLEAAEIGATREGAFVYVPRDWASMLDVTRVLDIPTAGPRYMLLYSYLRDNESATNRELTPHLGYESNAMTTRLPRRATFVRSTGRGLAARWVLNDGM